MSETLMGVKIDDITPEQFAEKIAEFFSDSRQHFITTPNPEMLVAANKNWVLRNVLNAADLNICDGKGVELALRGRVKRMPGADLMMDIISYCERNNHSIFLLGTGSKYTLDRAKNNLLQNFPNLRIVGTNIGPAIQIDKKNSFKLLCDEEENNKIVDQIIDAMPEVIFVAFGHEKQEMWIHQELSNLPSVRVAVGIGGALDMLAGHTPRAPGFFRKIGVEWLWRLMLEPSRWRRIWTAVVVFPWLVWRHKETDFK